MWLPCIINSFVGFQVILWVFCVTGRHNRWGANIPDRIQPADIREPGTDRAAVEADISTSQCLLHTCGFQVTSTAAQWVGMCCRCSVTFVDSKGRFPLSELTARVHGPSWRPENSAVYTGVRFPLPELTARVDGCQKMHPSSRAVNSAVNSGRELG